VSVAGCHKNSIAMVCACCIGFTCGVCGMKGAARAAETISGGSSNRVGLWGCEECFEDVEYFEWIHLLAVLSGAPCILTAAPHFFPQVARHDLVVVQKL
jgi:hypothetical protein